MRRTDRANRLLADVQSALYEQRDAERRLSLYTNTLAPKAQESFAVTEAAFSAGTADFLDLIDAQRVLLEFRLAAERARADLAQAVAELDRLLGRFVLAPRDAERTAR